VADRRHQAEASPRRLITTADTEEFSMAIPAPIDRQHPGCFMFLLDQSQSMQDPIPGASGSQKAQVLADLINDLLLTVVSRCIKEKDEPPRYYYDIGIIGYGAQVQPLLGGPLGGRTLASVEEIANNVVRTVEGNEGLRPIWFEAASSGRTPMCAALDMAGKTVAAWIHSHPDSFPPIVINISDGRSTDGDPAIWGERLRTLATSNGKLLFFNICISSFGGAPVSFPSSDVDLRDEDGRVLFRLSSELPEFMRRKATELGYSVQPGARGFVYNADMDAVVNALNVGTSTDQMEDL
jgi:hypothetical protein